MEYLKLSGVSKAFGFVPAVCNVSFQAARGDTVCLVGENGAGKSTLLRCISGSLRPDTGEVLLEGKSVFSLRGRRSAWRRIGIIDQEHSFFYEDLSCFENLSLYARISGTSDSEQAVLGAIERVGLSQSRLQKVRELSGGMRKRLSLARLVLLAPPLLVLDEPFAHLDESAEGLLVELIAEFSRRRATIVFATHRLDLASRLADQVLVLEHGRVVDAAAKSRTGRPEELLQ